MEYEYVALLYWTGLPKADEEFTRNFGEHLGQGWKEYIRASWPRQKKSISTGGVCIMRRPKDEPLARSVRCLACGTHWWPQTGRCPHCGNEYKLAREEPKDEPRKGWTERRELQRRNEELAGRCSKHVEQICALTDRIVRLDAAIAEVIAILGRLAFSEMPKEETNGCLCGQVIGKVLSVVAIVALMIITLCIL